MKSLNEFIIENITFCTAKEYIKEGLFGKRNVLQPRKNKELRELVKKLIVERGVNADLNDIDVSKVTDFTGIFQKLEFNGDISKWDVSNARTMKAMFASSKFNGDISKWDVSKVKDMSYMFYGNLAFNQDISGWDVRKVENITSMFASSNFNQDISGWKLESILRITDAFRNNKIFNQNIDSWSKYIDPKKIENNINLDIYDTPMTFKGSAMETNKPNWYIWND